VIEARGPAGAGRAVALSVVIPVRNAAQHLGSQLRSLARQDWSGAWEVIVADNGSSDATRDVAASFAGTLPLLRIVESREGIGHAVAANGGIGAARGEKILFLDADDEVAPGYLAAMADALEHHRLVGARLDSVTLNAPWSVLSRPASQEDAIDPLYGFLPAAAGCSIGVRRSLVQQIGGFDPNLPVCDDIDFCWRALLAGAELVFVPDAVVLYRYRDTLGSIFRQARGYGRAGPLLYRKYREKGMPRRSWRSVCRYWLGAASRVLRAWSKARRAEAAFLLGQRFGIIEGCWRSRVWYL
jgi:GT2 family glycosyltransferase